MSTSPTVTQTPSITTTAQQTTPSTTTTTVISSTPVSVQYATARPVPPLLATTSATPRTIVTEQIANAVPVVLSTRPVQQVTQIRIQTQPAANSLQRRGLALTVSYVIPRTIKIINLYFSLARANVGSSRYVPYGK